MCKVSTGFLCRKIKNIPGNLLRLRLRLGCCCSHCHVAPPKKNLFVSIRRRDDNEDGTLPAASSPRRAAPTPAWHMNSPIPFSFSLHNRIAGIKFFHFLYYCGLIFNLVLLPHPPFENSPFFVVLKKLRALRHGQVVGDAREKLLKLQREKLVGMKGLEGSLLGVFLDFIYIFIFVILVEVIITKTNLL